MLDSCTLIILCFHFIILLPKTYINQKGNETKMYIKISRRRRSQNVGERIGFSLKTKSQPDMN